jgi:hypothetical protein
MITDRHEQVDLEGDAFVSRFHGLVKFRIYWDAVLGGVQLL